VMERLLERPMDYRASRLRFEKAFWWSERKNKGNRKKKRKTREKEK